MNRGIHSSTRVRAGRAVRTVVGVVIVATIAMALGCDSRPTRVALSGQILIDGQPLTRGNVKFVPKDGRPSSGKIGDDGRFTLTCYDGNDGAIPGRHRVQVSANRIISDSKIEWFAPQQYADFRTSGIEVEVTEPTEDLKIELSWGGKKGPYIDGS